MRFAGYQPSGPGRLEGGYCVAWIKDNLRIAGPSGTDVVVSAAENHADHTLELGVAVTMPDQVAVRLLADHLVLSSPDWPQSKALPIVVISAPGPRQYPPLAVLRGSDRPEMNSFTLWFRPVGKGNLNQTGIPAIPRFSLELPPMEIDGQGFQPGIVRFEPYRKWGMYYCVQ